MLPNLEHNILPHQAKALLDAGSLLANSNIGGVLELDAGSECTNEVFIEDCSVENLKCLMVYFQRKVTIRNCNFKSASFNFCYFFGGLTIENCTFDEYLDFESGGHNDSGPIMIRGNQFKGFVNFCDCWFTGKVFIENNNFEKGTNICSNEQLVSFDIPLSLGVNTGDLAVQGECRAEER
ncbi:MAG: hypothetical protein EOP48_09660 [Sphingobacteriales bacterium]|nr:MAG: hypothetical protein EOP48_09660 [Sphingobacteriales bacterium]